MTIKLVPPPGQSFQTKQALVYHTLRDAIMHARLIPGERLVIDDIAAQLEVSPIPVREALQLLQSERLVEHKPHVGAVVAAVTAADAEEIFALLAALEQVVFTAAISKITDEQVKDLSFLVERMSALGENERWMDHNHQFHRTIATIAGMPRALEMLDRVSGEWERLRRLHFRNVRHPDTAVADREHRAMVEALAKRDPEALHLLVKAHNEAALAHYAGR
jgi:DNA-binding GntR family transcriptional regulator